MHARRNCVYAILADYREHHPRILPAAYFTSLTVEEGGIGAGTIFRAEMNVFGNRRTAAAQSASIPPNRAACSPKARSTVRWSPPSP